MRVLRILLPLLALLFGINTKILSQRKCGTDQVHQQKLNDPSYRAKFENTRTKILRSKGSNRSTIMIPVAFHFNGSVTAADMCCLISASLAQIEVLNQDFASMNNDISLYTTIANACPVSFPPGSLSPGLRSSFL